MCYRVITHALRCDIRPILSDGHSLFVDNYAGPCKCNCVDFQTSIKSWFRCENHGCCMRTAKLYECASVYKNCEVREYHRYEQAKPPKSTTWCKTVPDSLFPNMSFQLNWPSVRNFDEAGHAWMKNTARIAPQENKLYKLALDNVLSTGHMISNNLTNIENLTNDLEEQRQAHNMAHGPCERVLNPWECPELSHIYTFQRALDKLYATLAKQMELYAANTKLHNMAKEDMKMKTKDQMLNSGFALEEWDALFVSKLDVLPIQVSPLQPLRETTKTQRKHAPVKTIKLREQQGALGPDGDDEGEFFTKSLLVLHSLELL
ncbi:Fc.00g038690.m01.CDS01 [Cosmosporella sp. VM-42]